MKPYSSLSMAGGVAIIELVGGRRGLLPDCCVTGLALATQKPLMGVCWGGGESHVNSKKLMLHVSFPYYLLYHTSN